MSDRKNLVFISHANPEDNEFCLWIASRLTSLGYLVWSDLTKLFGAEIFWNDIEEAIRQHSAKVLVILSRSAQQKEGVLDEINLAVSVERKEKLDRFVVPIRIDDLPFSDIRPNLGRKNVIDFNKNRAEGLGKLIKVLDRDNVPRNNEISSREMSAWIEKILAGSKQIINEPEILLSNWFQIIGLPDTLNFLLIPIPNNKIRSKFENFSYPVYPYQNMIVTFASVDDVNEHLPFGYLATYAYKIPLLNILNGESHQKQQLSWSEASNILSYLLRIAWDSAMRFKKLRLYELSSGRKAWFPPKEYSVDGWTRYLDMNDRMHKRRLVGQSKTKHVHWHFAMEVWPSLGHESRIALKPHVVFTEDGYTPVSSPQRMHQLRRGFCKSWWNPRWRDLLLAYISLITNGDESITIPVGSEQKFLVARRPMIFRSPISFINVLDLSSEEDETDSQLDALSDPFEWEDNLEIDNTMCSVNEVEEHEDA